MRRLIVQTLLKILKNLFFSAAGLSGSAELGVAVGAGDNTTGNFMVYAGVCAGLALDAGAAGSVVIGVWNKLNDVPGTSYALGVGLDALGVGPSLGIVLNDRGSYIGATVTFSLGPGDPIPFEVSAHWCKTHQLN